MAGRVLVMARVGSRTAGGLGKAWMSRVREKLGSAVAPGSEAGKDLGW